MNFKTNPPGRRTQIMLLVRWLTVFLGIAASHAASDAFQDLSRMPNAVTAEAETGTVELSPDAHGIWRGGGLTVETRKGRDGLAVELAAPSAAVKSLRLSWNTSPAPDFLYLGDAWERAYGDLEWQPLDGRRVMPWYFLGSNGRITHGYAVKTGAGALCYWTVTPSNIVLNADVRCGGSGVQLGRRVLGVCTVICRPGRLDETPFAAAREFCGLMCPHPKLPAGPVYGFNDWYCSYGHDTAEEFLKNAGYMVSLAPKGGARPFAVVDDGWETDTEQAKTPELWNRVKPSFSTTLDMAQFAKRIQALGAAVARRARPAQGLAAGA
jgi:alpha-galactosidase